MDASCDLQENIHMLELNQYSMCPESWVHINIRHAFLFEQNYVPDIVQDD